MIATAPEPRAAARVITFNPADNPAAAIAMALETPGAINLAVNPAAAIAMVLETLAAAQVMSMVLEALAVAQVTSMDPVAAVVLAQAINLEAALAVGQAMVTMTLRIVRIHLVSYNWRFWCFVSLMSDCHAESTKDKLLGKVEGVLGRNKKENGGSAGGYDGKINDY